MVLYGIDAHVGQWLTLLFIALALGMDAFSLGIGVGVRVSGNRQIVKISVLTGIFHLAMPLAGMFFGGLIQRLVGPLALLFSGILLAALGLHMAIQAWRDSRESSNSAATIFTFWSMLVFAFSVSVDSLSIGFSLGMVGVNVWLALFLFAACATALCALGLSLGKALNQYIGRFGEVAGGLILLILGLKFIYVSIF
jgi:putative Mn2+ efflux pump MntP